ncbi:MAG: thrombospondin type 3 repeat-containing protein, partial [Candidatus Poseidoniaceae archaeon]|nr:thrombospondin type 3 repeat-containing protein [Candidatus Poseidoniaceae archaeon]
MKQRFLPILISFLFVIPAISVADDTTPQCEAGESTQDRIGCLDSDGDGWSDPDEHWNASMGADAFPNNASEHRDLDGDGIGDVSDPDMDGDLVNDEIDVWPEDSVIWSDSDGDGYADQTQHEMSDNCPYLYGKSKIRLKGCSDIDGDFMPDEYDDDADGDGVGNGCDNCPGVANPEQMVSDMDGDGDL